MEALKLASDDSIKSVIVDILSTITLFSKEEIQEGLGKCTMFKIDDMLRAVIKTPIPDTLGRTTKLLIIGSHLGDKAIADREISQLVLTAPEKDDMVKLTALFMFSNKEKMRQAIQKRSLFLTHV
jgi:hypothetical protein